MQENCTYLSSVLREFPKYDNLTSKVNPHIWVSQNESAFVSKLPLKFHRNSIPHAQINRKKKIFTNCICFWGWYQFAIDVKDTAQYAEVN